MFDSWRRQVWFVHYLLICHRVSTIQAAFVFEWLTGHLWSILNFFIPDLSLESLKCLCWIGLNYAMLLLCALTYFRVMIMNLHIWESYYCSTILDNTRGLCRVTLSKDSGKIAFLSSNNMGHLLAPRMTILEYAPYMLFPIWHTHYLQSKMPTNRPRNTFLFLFEELGSHSWISRRLCRKLKWAKFEFSSAYWNRS